MFKGKFYEVNSPHLNSLKTSHIGSVIYRCGISSLNLVYKQSEYTTAVASRCQRVQQIMVLPRPLLHGHCVMTCSIKALEMPIALLLG